MLVSVAARTGTASTSRYGRRGRAGGGGSASVLARKWTL